MQLCFGLVMGYWGKSVSGQTPHLKYFSLLIGGKVLLVYKTHWNSMSWSYWRMFVRTNSEQQSFMRSFWTMSLKDFI